MAATLVTGAVFYKPFRGLWGPSMPGWLISAFALLRSRLVVGGAALGAGAEVTSRVLEGGISAPLDLFAGFGGRRGTRRRRRRALTASDRADIAFISGTLGKPAAKDFTVALIAGLSR